MEFYDPDVLILGGGASGLFLLDSLRRKGYSAALIEKNSLGEGQTIASQGVIHTGVKYALNGPKFRADSVSEVADMGVRWQEMLEGRASPDLSKVKVLTDISYLWFSKKGDKGELLLNPEAEGLLQVKPREMHSGFPPILRDAARVYEIAEKVIDASSLLERLAKPNSDNIFYARNGKIGVDINEGGWSISIEDRSSRESSRFDPQAIVLAAGEGNEELALQFGLQEKIMQRRPLRQIFIRDQTLPKLYGICVNGGIPAAVITTHPSAAGVNLWNIGGDIAESGACIHKNDTSALSDFKREATDKLEEMFPSLRLGSLGVKSYSAERAEPLTVDGQRPGGVHVANRGNIIFGWPTKLTLIPRFADYVIESVAIFAQPSGKELKRRTNRGQVITAFPPWNSLGLR